MLYRSMSLLPHKVFIVLVIELFLLSVNIRVVLATSSCVGGHLRPIKESSETRNIFLFSGEEGGVIPIAVPGCFKQLDSFSRPLSTRSLNVTYVIEGVPLANYLIISGNITGSGTVSITDSQGKLYSNSSGNLTNFRATIRSRTIYVNYRTVGYLQGDGPSIDVFSTVPSLLNCSDWRRLCSVTFDHHPVCLPKEWICNGRDDCHGGSDESGCLYTRSRDRYRLSPEGCCEASLQVGQCTSAASCSCSSSYNYKREQSFGNCNGEYKIESVSSTSGSVSLPKWPQVIPYNITYIWNTSNTDRNITLTFQQANIYIHDVVTIYNGDTAYPLTGLSSGVKRIISVKSNQVPRLNIVIMSPTSVYNFSYEFSKATNFPPGAVVCVESISLPHCFYGNQCYVKSQRCDGVMDCTNGEDEVGCGTLKQNGRVVSVCGKNEIMCGQVDGKRGSGCFNLSMRCDGSNKCTNGYDESNCDATLCGTHNGTFLCPKDQTCIFETWLCDDAWDCTDGADEQNCEGTSLKVITASVIGSLVCAIMIVIAVGCSCKLHTHRQYENMHHRSRYESPMTQITNELMRRTAPPPYAEAMQRSRPFEEVQNEYLAALEQHRNEESPEYTEDTLEEERSVASASGIMGSADTSLIELSDDTVSYRRNPNKPPETVETRPDRRDVDQTLVSLDPKSDEEPDAGDLPPSHQASADDATSNSSQSRRQILRRSSVDSDVSLLSRDSDDAPLLL